MKTGNISFCAQPVKQPYISKEIREKKVIEKLYSEYKKQPFDYANVNYGDDMHTIITIHREYKLLPKLKTFFRNMIKNIRTK